MLTSLSFPRRLLAVFSGGFFGTVVRYLLSLLIQTYLSKNWPYDILIINITGTFMLACVTTLADASVIIGPTRRLIINVGFLGAYTTFSSLALGDVLLFANARWLLALLYLFLSLAGGAIAVLAGDVVGNLCIKLVKKRMRFQTIDPTPKDHLDVQDDLLLPD